MPASRQATGVGFPCAIDTSIWRSSVTICSALNLFFGMTQAPFQAHSLTTLGSKKPGQVKGRQLPRPMPACLHFGAQQLGVDALLVSIEGRPIDVDAVPPASPERK